jgi:all-trans-retinol 13,14-reductase
MFVYIGLTLVIGSTTYLYRSCIKKTLPKQYSNEKLQSYGIGNIKNRFQLKKVPEKIDAIVIGSGLGGLTTAGLLSRVGKRVLVIEQHYIAGGCTHAFEDKGYEFDTGLHYVGNVEKINKILDLITDTPIKWDKLHDENYETYDEICIGNNSLKFVAGEEQLYNQVKIQFPDEVDNVRKYIQDVKKTAKYELYFMLKVLKNTYIRKIVNKLNWSFFNSMNENAESRIKKYVKNEILQQLLLGQYGDTGLPPAKTPFYIHASITNHYLNGGYYPRGGTSVIAKRIIPIIESTGGKVLVAKKVKSIIIDNSSGEPIATGIEMINGHKIYAKTIISACSANATWKQLVDPKYIPKSLSLNLNKTGLSASALYLFVGMNKSNEELKLRATNIWHLPNGTDANKIEKAMENPLDNENTMFIGFPSAKDSDWNNRHPGKSTCVMISIVDYNYFEKWKDDQFNRRSNDYKELKEKLSAKMLDILYKYYPQTKECIDYVNLATPLTFNYYINSIKGEMYGIGCNTNRFNKDDWLTPNTHIKNLYLSGVDILAYGISGAINSGVITTNAVLDYGTPMDIVTGRDLIQDIDTIR